MTKTKAKKGELPTRYAIKHASTLNNSPCGAIATEGQLYLLNMGFCDLRAPALGWDWKVIYIEYRKKPVAVMLWTYQEWCKTAWINLSYVRPRHRKNGLYRAMYEALKRDGQDVGFTRISAGIHVLNRSMIIAAEKTGRVPCCEIWEEYLR